MRVVVLGSGVVGVTSAYYLARAGHDVTVIDREAGRRSKPASRTQVRFRRLRVAVGGARRAAEGHQVDVPEARAACSPARRHVVPAAMDVANAAELHVGALRGEQGPYGPPRRIQPRVSASAARRHRHSVRRPHGRHAAGVPHAAATRRRRERHGRAERRERSLRTVDAGRPRPRRTGTRHDGAQTDGRLASARRRNRRLPTLHDAPSRARRTARREIPLQHADRCARDGRRPHRRREVRRRNDPRGHLRRRARLVFDAVPRRHREDSGVPAKGLFDYRACHQRCGGAGFHRPRRDVQDRDHALRQPDSRRRHGRNRRLRQAVETGAPRDARDVRQRSVPGRRRYVERDVLDRSAPDDAGRNADRRPHPRVEPVPEHGPRHAGMDDVVRFGSTARRSDFGQEAGDPVGRSVGAPLSGETGGTPHPAYA